MEVVELRESEVQSEILQRLTRVETKLDLQLDARDKAGEALESAKSAHLRLDEKCMRLEEIESHYDNEIRLLNARLEAETASLVARIEAESRASAERLKTEQNERKSDRHWLVGIMLTAGSLIVAAIKLF
ncbi:hypothetical protein SAMN05216312_101760 [Cohnella sp. OV330]|uniref:hypothetical protein n=1 Tax=Cohnella sp. OV330 TaxID=1855288 RepID=UPI0008EF432D|nr:hypothetical protein [Cohnella sp. OV330]SFA83163.1 hypothetical protein SAMN05216312_101760 [Cohnella sp. OV330]